jgi:hypothetical protein
MLDQPQFYKSEGGGQFFQILSENEVKVISLYDFNPIIERRRLSSTIIAQLKCTPCSKEEFEKAQFEAIQLLDLPEPALIPA